jgi:hypothetical protein
VSYTKGAVIGGVVVAVVAGLAIALVFAIRSNNEWAAWCQSQGGHVTSHTTTTTVVTANGKPGIATTTTSYCLSADGRILDIR